MGIGKKIVRAAKFTIVDVPLNFIGFNYNRKIFLWLRSSLTRSTNPACPECTRGVLMCVDESVDATTLVSSDLALTEKLYKWSCSDCSFLLLDSRNRAKVRDTVSRLRFQSAQAAFSEMERAEIDRLAQGHRRGSRIFFCMAMLVFANFVRLVVLNAPIMIALNWGGFSAMFWVLGMIRSYRTWQVSTGHLFVKGAFWHWFKHEKWVR